MKISGQWLVRAGFLVLALTNAVILLQVAYNREGPPDSVLALTNRELMPQWSSTRPDEEHENVSLQLRLRAEGLANAAYSPQGQWETLWPNSSSGPILWLDAAKLATLGFDVGMSPTADGSDAHYARMNGRQAYLVLEFDGPTSARALQAARDQVARLQSAATGNPQQSGAAQRQLQSAQEALQSEESDRSRLFIVDAGLDRAALRQRYSDRARYAIVVGSIKPILVRYAGPAAVYGTVSAVRPASIYVPIQFRPDIPFAQTPVRMWARSVASGEKRAAFTAQVAFGRLLEPWILSAGAGAT